MRSLIVNEIFGPTFQGEGLSLGVHCIFLRLSACNLACSWCDTPYTWDWTGKNGTTYDPKTESHRMSLEEVVSAIRERDPSEFLVISGGEPLLQQEALIELIPKLPRKMEVQIETAGTVMPLGALESQVTLFNVSPKLSHSGNPKEKRYRPEVLDAFQASRSAVDWKFVVRDRSDLDEVDQIVKTHGLWPIYIMPEGIDAETLLRRSRDLAPAILERGWNLTTRLHTLLWGNTRRV